MRLDQWLADAERRLAAVSDSPRLEAQVLAGHILGVSRTWLITHPEAEITDETPLVRRERHEPLAYIVGRREFYGRDFTVSPAVLIPRQDTETLVEAALRLGPPTGRVLDIGVGSGAIAVTLKLERPAWDITGVDLSPEALAVAMQNAITLRADVRFLQSDGFGALTDERFDLIVSNPPYIGRDEILMPEVYDFEPHLALFAGEEGLAFYRRLAQEASNHLSVGGMLLMEVGHTQAEAVRTLFEAVGWRHVETFQDLAGIPRVVAFQNADVEKG